MNYAPTSRTPSFPNAQLFFGVVETTVQALRLVEAARQGMVPRIIRRLNETERQDMIKSGAVFVFSVEGSGIKRWTDSMVWSPSRIVGNFLLYREMQGRGSRASQRASDRLESPLTRGGAQEGFTPSSARSPTGNLVKLGGLLKKTITVPTNGGDLHLVAYYTQDDVLSSRLNSISSRPEIATIDLQLDRFRLLGFRYPPKVVIDEQGLSNMACDPEAAEPTPADEYSADTSGSREWCNADALDTKPLIPQSFVRGTGTQVCSIDWQNQPPHSPEDKHAFRRSLPSPITSHMYHVDSRHHNDYRSSQIWQEDLNASDNHAEQHARSSADPIEHRYREDGGMDYREHGGGFSAHSSSQRTMGFTDEDMSFDRTHTHAFHEARGGHRVDRYRDHGWLPNSNSSEYQHSTPDNSRSFPSFDRPSSVVPHRERVSDHPWSSNRHDDNEYRYHQSFSPDSHVPSRDPFPPPTEMNSGMRLYKVEEYDGSHPITGARDY